MCPSCVWDTVMKRKLSAHGGSRTRFFGNLARSPVTTYLSLVHISLCPVTAEALQCADPPFIAPYSRCKDRPCLFREMGGERKYVAFEGVEGSIPDLWYKTTIGNTSDKLRH